MRTLAGAAFSRRIASMLARRGGATTSCVEVEGAELPAHRDWRSGSKSVRLRPRGYQLRKPLPVASGVAQRKKLVKISAAIPEDGRSDLPAAVADDGTTGFFGEVAIPARYAWRWRPPAA